MGIVWENAMFAGGESHKGRRRRLGCRKDLPREDATCTSTAPRGGGGGNGVVIQFSGGKRGIAQPGCRRLRYGKQIKEKGKPETLRDAQKGKKYSETLIAPPGWLQSNWDRV